MYESDPFDCTGLEMHQEGKTRYWISDGIVRIEREGYSPGLHVYAYLKDLKYLKDNKDKLRKMLKGFSASKKTLVYGFINEVSLNSSAAQSLNKEVEVPDRVKKLQEIAKINQERWNANNKKEEGV